MDLLLEFKEYLLSQKNPSSKLTVKNYICDVRKFVTWFETRFKTAFSPSMVTLETIEVFKEENPNLSARSLDRCLSTFRKFFNFLLLEGVISENPLKNEDSKSLTGEDPWHIKEFKDYLYVYNASTLTIKNYLADIKSFLNWVENVTIPSSEWDIKAKNLFSKLNNELIEEYKQRIMPTNEAGLSPATVNRKLSSLRKYITWAEEKGYIDEKPQISNLESQQSKLNFKNLEQKKVNQPSNMIHNYSSFPPFRLIQKTKQAMGVLLEAILVNPLAFTIKGFEYLTWKIKGRPVFTEIQNSKLRIRSLPKEIYAPLLISTKNFSFYKKLIFSLRHNRPKWYKTYHSYALSHYLHFAILVMIMSAIGFGLYQNINEKPLNQGVLGIDNPKSPPRILSFQGKLTDSSGNPITSATSLRFAIYNTLSASGSALMWQEVDTVTPDSDGIFSVLLGNVSTMQQSMFAEHAGLWLGVSVGKTAELTPRQQLATVAFAENSETLEGLPPITNSDAGTKNVVLALDSSGNLTIGGTAKPTFQATGGQLTLSGNILLLTTLAGGNSDIIASPSGLGKIDLNKPIQNTSNNNNVSTAVGSVEVDDTLAVLATSSAVSAFNINQNGTGSLISASINGTAKFAVDNSGNLSLTGGNFSQTGSTTLSTGTGAVSLNGDATIASGKNLTVTSGNTSLTSATTTSNALSLTDTALTSGTGFAKVFTSNAGNGQTTVGESIALTDATTAGGGYTGLSISTSGSGTGSGNKYLLDLNPGTNKDVVFDSAGALRPTVAVSSNTNTLGSPSFYWKNIYVDTVTANTLAGSISGSGTSATSWTLGNTQTGDVNEALIFQRNSGSGNATLQWNAGTNDLRYLTTNYPLNATYTVDGTSIGTGINLLSANLTNNTVSGTQKLLSLTNTGTGTTENGIYINNTGTGTTGLEIAGTWTTGLLTNNNSINAGTGAITGGAVTGSSLTASGLSTAGVVTNSAAGLLGTLAGTTTTVLHGNAGGTPTFASVSGSDLASNITISTTGNISTTGTGTITSAGTLTASNGLTLTTGVLNLTATSGSTSLTGYGTTSITSTTASGNILTLADSSFTTTGANLANLTFTNTNAGAGAVTTNGLSITPTGTVITGGGSNTLNAINLPNVTAITSNTFNGLNIGTGYNNLINSANFTVTAAGTVTAVGVNSGSGLLQGTGGLTVTGTGNINATGTSATNIGNSAVTGILTLASGGASGWTNTSGNLTIQTATSGTTTIDSAGILNLGTVNSTATNLGKAATTLTINPTSWTATPTISGLITASSGVTLAANQNLTLNSGTGQYSQTYTGTTTNAAAITANSLTTGSALNLAFTQNAAAAAGSTANGLAITAATNTNTGNTADLINLASSGSTSTVNGIEFTGTLGNFTNFVKAGTTFVVNSSGNLTAGTYNGDTLSSTALTFSGASPTISASTTNTSLTINANGSGNLALLASGTGNVGINQANPGAELEVDNHVANQVAMLVKGFTSQSSDLLELQNSLGAVLAKVDSLGNLTANTLTSSVAQGTAPLAVTSTTVVANLNAAAAQEPMPNLVLNSDFSRRNKWMTFMPETFPTETPAAPSWTQWAGIHGVGTTGSNILTFNATDADSAIHTNFTSWRDARFSAQFKAVNTSNAYYAGKWTDSSNYVYASFNGGAGFRLLKVIGGVATVVVNVSQTVTLNNWYWLELESQGTTYIAKMYSSGASATAKSSATLLQTLSGTISDVGVTTGGMSIEYSGSAGDQAQWGGLSTGDGGVYVEGWGPETWNDEGQVWTTKGGLAFGLDETADVGPTGQQYVWRQYIPASNRSYYTSTSKFPVKPSTTYTFSWYEKTLNKSGTDPIATVAVNEYNSAGTNTITDTNANWVDSGETTWTRKSGTFTTGSTAVTARAYVMANYKQNTSPGASTGTAFVTGLQIEEGSIATPWRNAPADDGPIVWNLPVNSANLTTTSGTDVELNPRDWGVNAFLPWDGEISMSVFGTWGNSLSGQANVAGGEIDGSLVNGNESVYENVASTGTFPYGFVVGSVATQGKHRISVVYRVSGGNTLTLYNAPATQVRFIATKGKHDLAEEYSVLDPTIGAGDVVQLASNNSQITSNTTIEKSNKGYNSSVLGIVSTAPAVTLGSQVYLNNYQQGSNLRPVALSGRVPVKVTNENGPIHRGNTLTSSDKYPGYAMKATKAGRSIGIAMDDFVLDGTIGSTQFGTIMTFVNLSWYDPDVYLTDTGNFVINKTQNIAINPADQVLGTSSATNSAQLSTPQASPVAGCDPKIDPSNFGLVTKCPESNLLTYIQNSQAAKYAYQITDSAGNVIQRAQVLSEAVIGSLRAGAINAKDIIADNLIINNKVISPIAEVNIIKTNVITPLGKDKIVIRPNETAASSSATIKPILEIQNASGSAVASIDTAGNATFSGQLKTKELVTNNATVSGTLNSFGLVTENASVSGTLRTKNLIADNITSDVSNIKYLVSGITDRIASISGSLNTKYNTPNTDAAGIASYSAQLAYVNNLNATTAIFTQGFSALGPVSLTDASIAEQLSVGANLILADNSINVLGSDLNLQPLKQGGISFLSGKIYIDVNGNMTLNGNETVRGTLFANVLSPIPGNNFILNLLNENATQSSKFVIKNASGSAVASIDGEGNAIFKKLNLSLVSPAFALSEREVLATGSAGVATISARQKELTIDNKLVTDKSLIYISPVGTPSAQVPFLLRQTGGTSFTVGTQDINNNELPFNWLIIN